MEAEIVIKRSEVFGGGFIHFINLETDSGTKSKT